MTNSRLATRALRRAHRAYVHVTPNDSAAYLFELDASGRVVVASMRDAAVGARMTLTNVDLPLVSLDLGEDAARYQTYAVLPR